jgi:hypothetical protein
VHIQFRGRSTKGSSHATITRTPFHKTKKEEEDKRSGYCLAGSNLQLELANNATTTTTATNQSPLNLRMVTG